MINYLMSSGIASMVIGVGTGVLLIWVLCNMDEAIKEEKQEVKLYKEIKFQEE